MHDERVDETASTEGLGDRATHGAKWRFYYSLIQAGLQFAISIVLARLLPPAAFGLLALALIVTELARFASHLGIPSAVIQATQLTERHIRVAFTASWMLGIAVAALTFLGAPLADPFFDNHRVPDLLKLLSINFVIAGVGNTAGALLHRRLAYKTMFAIDLTSFLLGYAGVATVLAVAGFGVWSLVGGLLAQELLDTILLLAATRHPLQPSLSRKELRELVGFGTGYILGGITDYLTRTADNFVIGRWLGNAPLGLYTRAYGLMKLPEDHLGRIVKTVLFPTLSKLQGDRQRLGRTYLISVELTTLASLPVMAGMFVAAEHMIVGLYGQKWAGAAPPLQLLCLAGWLRVLYPLSGTVAQATGNLLPYFKRSLLAAVLVFGGGIYASRWGVEGVAGAVVVATALVAYLMARLSLQLVPFDWRDFFQTQKGGILMALLVGIPTYGLREFMEARGFSSLPIFLSILGASTVLFFAGIAILPDSVRPNQAFERILRSVDHWPELVRRPIRRYLRL